VTLEVVVTAVRVRIRVRVNPIPNLDDDISSDMTVVVTASIVTAP
jgi:hypothetical protein